MRERFVNLVLFSACLILFFASASNVTGAEARLMPLHSVKTQPQRRSVIDYFNLLPSYGIGDSSTRQERHALLQLGTDPDTNPIIDIRHDYLVIHPDSSPVEQIAVFRARGKSDLLAVSMPDSQSDYNDFALYHLHNGKLRDVTCQMLPTPPQTDRLLYLVPEFGTTIRVFRFNIGDKAGRHAFDLQWRGGRFVKVR